MTTGTMMFIGGIGGAALLTIMLIASIPIFRAQKKKMKKEISKQE